MWFPDDREFNSESNGIRINLVGVVGQKLTYARTLAKIVARIKARVKDPKSQISQQILGSN